MTPSPDRLRRFTRGELWVHRCLAALMGTCILTAAMLYLEPLSTLVGRRHLVASIHYASGLLLPLPILVGVVWSAAFRADVRRLNRFLPGDWRWLRSGSRRDGSIPSGKFNAGQKLNSAFVLGSVLVLFGTGLMLHHFSLFPDAIRTGATFVHDTFAAAVVVVSAGHVWMAAHDPEARRGLRTGFVTPGWAQREHALWAAQAEAARPDATAPQVVGPDSSSDE